ncbi:MAG: transglycosylase SLT domain-containing protein [Nitrospinaceae bacterium]
MLLYRMKSLWISLIFSMAASGASWVSLEAESTKPLPVPTRPVKKIEQKSSPQIKDIPKIHESLYQKMVKARITQVLTKYHTGLEKEREGQIPRIIFEQSQKYGYDPLFLTAVIITESSFYNRARSVRDALGLMQIRPRTGRALASEMKTAWKGKNSLYEPKINIAMGAYYLNKLLNRFGDLELALEAYNHGPTRVTRYLKRGYQPEKYSRKVFYHYNHIRLSERDLRLILANRPLEKSPGMEQAPLPLASQIKVRLASWEGMDPIAHSVAIHPGDTLWKISESLGYNRKEATRVAVTLWMDNRDSFIKGNMHGIRAGKILKLNYLKNRLAEVDSKTARRIVREQWREWNTGVKKG